MSDATVLVWERYNPKKPTAKGTTSLVLLAGDYSPEHLPPPIYPSPVPAT